MLSENGVGRSVFHSVNFSVSALILGSGLLFFLAWLIVGWLGSDVEERRGSTPLADRVVSNTPLLGTLHRHAKAAEACEILGILVEKGHSAREAIAVAKNAVAGPSLLSALEDVETAIVAGETYTVGEKKSLIPQTTLWMLSIAPENHEMGPALRSLAEYHRRQIEILSGFIREILEPLLLLVVAVLGGLAIIAFYSSTIFQISLFQLI
jgi:type IV pilus assembly protein PilC